MGLYFFKVLGSIKNNLEFLLFYKLEFIYGNGKEKKKVVCINKIRFV